MTESGLWNYIKRGMLGKWHATRIESSAGNGVPDISFGLSGKNGWLELKYIKEWPLRNSTTVKLPLRNEQKLWIKTRGEIAGDVWVLVRIQDDFFLLNHREAYALSITGKTRSEWLLLFQTRWLYHIDFDEMLAILKKGCTDDNSR